MLSGYDAKRGRRAGRAVWAAGLWLAGAPAGCHAITGIGDYAVDECSVNADCSRARGDTWVCRRDKVCVNLQSPDCPRVVGDYQSDDAVLFGALVPLTGEDAPVGQAEVNAIWLAVTDFKGSNAGLPPAPGSSARRPLAVVICDDASRIDVGARAASYLANEVGVPAIIGSNFSGVTINVATKVTIPAGTLLISPGATSPDITNMPDNNLVWRTIASGAVEAVRVAALVDDLEADVRARLEASQVIAAGDPLKLDIVYKGDAYGRGFTEATLPVLRLNGAGATDAVNRPYFKESDYGNPGDPTAGPPRYAETVSDLVAREPHIIIAYGINEVFANIIGPVEQAWKNPAYRPYWVFSHSQFNGAVTEFLRNNDPSGDVRRRMIGTIGGSSYSQGYSVFRLLYEGRVNDGTVPNSFGASNAYDAVYLLAYSTVLAGAAPLTGSALAAGFGRLTPPGDRVSVGSADINRTFGLITAGKNADIEGSSGPLDFDLATGDINSQVEVWCVPLAGGAPGAPSATPFHFDIDGTRVGTLADTKAACGLL
jgi:branched-chain amino acid transport system substrate-binding protein